MVRKSQPARLVISPVYFWRGRKHGEGGNSVRQYEASAGERGKGELGVRYGTRPAQQVERSVRMTSNGSRSRDGNTTYTHDDGLVAVLLVV